jgi:PAS domain S-box-containing protein
MKDQSKTKQSLIQELASLKKRITELEKLESAHKRAEKTLRESEEFSNQLIAAMPDIVIRTDMQGKILFVNDKGVESSGYTKEEIVEKNMLSFIAPEDMEIAIQNTILMIEQPLGPKEYHMIISKGRRRLYEINGSVLKNESGVPYGLVYVIRDITRRKQAEAAMKQSEDTLRTIIEGTQASMVRVDINGHFNYANDAMAKALGYGTAEEIIGKPYLHFIHPDDRRRVMNTYLHQIETRQPSVTQEFRIVSTEGRIMWLSFLSSIVIKDGQVVGQTGVAQNITERKQTEEALQASEEKFRQIVSSIPNIVAILDMNLQFIYASASVQRILGYTPEEAMTVTLEQLCTPESLAIAYKSFQERLEANARVPDPNYVLILELEEYRKNGSTVILENTMTFLRDANGAPVGILCVAADITERKQTEEALRESEEKYKFLVENTNDIIWVFDLETMSYSFCSNSVERILGFTAEETVGMKLDDVFSPEAKKAVQAAFWKIVAGKEPSDRVLIEVEHIAKNGNRLWMEINAVVKRDKSGKPVAFNGVTRDITARKLAEDELKLRNVLLSTQQEVSIDGILVVDENGTIISFNRRFVEIWSIPTDVVESKSDELALQSVLGRLADPDEFMAKVRHLYENRSETSRDEIALKDGRILDRYSAPMLGDDGKYYGRIWYFRDITKRKRSEHALYESERRLADIINFLPIATMVIDREGKITAWNRAMEEITGVKRDNMIGKGDYKYAIPFYGKRRPILIDRVFDTDKGIETHYTNIHYEKGVLSAESYIPNLGIILVGYASKLQDAAGNVVGAIESVRDVTDIRRVEAELKEAEEKYRTILETMDSGYYEIDLEGNVLFFNPALRAFLGYGDQEMKGVNFSDWVDPEEVDRVYGIFKEVHRSGDPNVDFYVRVTRKNGKKAYSAVSSFPMRDDQGDIVGFSGTVRDITALKEAKDAADAANQSKSIFLANMSHEIRTPMNAILGFAQLIERDPQLSPRSREHLEIINRSGEHLMALINDILEMSKIEAGRATFVQNTFDLHALLRDIERMFHVRTDAKNLRFLLEMVGPVPRWVFTDEGKLRQVLINLLGNAVKFTREGGIALRLSAKAGKADTVDLQFEVEDTGPGMAEEEISHLFKAFEQTRTGLQTGGTGLGLSLSQGFIQIMGGSISVASAVGKGTIFRFQIPVRESSEEHTSSKEAKRRVLRLSPGQNDIRVLIADDRETNRQLLSRLLGMAGFQTREVVNGEEAVQMVHEWKPRVVLMDMTMPVMNGYEATRIIKESPDIRNTAIIAVTASAFDEDRQRVLAAGADAYLSKPFKDADLFENIGRLIGVEYLYEETDAAKASETMDDKALMLKTVSSLPPDLVSHMRKAVESADLDLLNDFAGQLVTDHPALAKWIQEMAARYEYEALIEIFSKGG